MMSNDVTRTKVSPTSPTALDSLRATRYYSEEDSAPKRARLTVLRLRLTTSDVHTHARQEEAVSNTFY